jgi:hypothetical protein
VSRDEPTPASFVDRLALCRAEAGRFAPTVAGVLVGEHGREVSGDVAAAVRRLLDDGCLAHGATGPFGRRPVKLTLAGAVRLSELSGGGGRG